MQGLMFDFKEKKPLCELDNASVSSSVLFDLRTDQQKSYAKYNDQTLTLKHSTLNVFSHRPLLIHQQTMIGNSNPQVTLLELQKIILRTNSFTEESMTLSLVDASPPFPVLKKLDLDRKSITGHRDVNTIVPATYSRATTQ